MFSPSTEVDVCGGADVVVGVFDSGCLLLLNALSSPERPLLRVSGVGGGGGGGVLVSFPASATVVVVVC